MDDLRCVDLASLKVLVVLEGVILGRVVVVGWALSLVEGSVLLAHLLLVAEGVVHVHVGEDAIVRHGVVGRGGLEIVQVGETGSVVSAEVSGHILVAVIDGVSLLALEVLEHVVLHDGVLVDGTSVSAGSFAGDAVTDGKDILIFAVLKGVAVDIDLTLGIANTSVEKELVLARRRVDGGTDEVLLNSLTSVDVSENGNLAGSVFADGQKLPSEIALNTALSALLESDLVSVRERVDELVGSPVLNASTSSGTVNELILAQDRLVVKRVEVSALALVGNGGRVVDIVAAGMVPSVVEVARKTLLLIKLVDEDIV